MSNAIKIIVLVFVAAIVAVVLRTLFIAASRPGPPVPPTFDRVRVAADDLPQGLLLRDQDLSWKQMKRSDIPSSAIVEGAKDAELLKGAVLRHPLQAGAMVTTADVIPANAPGFLSATLKPNMRAISVAVDDVSGNAGLIQPGDYVDLILTQNMSGKTDVPTLEVSSETVVQHARVLAVGSELQPPQGATADPNPRARTVTLEVTPRTAEVVAVAARLGSLSLALRSFATLARSGADDTTLAASSALPVWAGDISRAVRELPSNRKNNAPGEAAPHHTGSNAPPPVVIYRGTKTDDATTDAAGNAAPPLPSVPNAASAP